MACCPPGSWGACDSPAGYVNKGKNEALGPTLNGYVVRPATGTKNGKAIVVFTDLFGNDSGRVKAICDDYAEKLDCLVVLPNTLEGDEWKEAWGMPNQPIYNLLWFIPWCIRHNTNKTMALFESDIRQFFQKESIESFGMASFCYGACSAAALSSLPGAKAHVGFHPSYQVFSLSFGPSMAQTLSAVKCPQLYCVAANDQVTPGGPAEVTVRDVAKQEVVVNEYPNQRHGWVNRGDVSKPEVASDVIKALHQGEMFFKKYLV